jgi:dihydroorotate dehydrogenase electron transfer subunit
LSDKLTATNTLRTTRIVSVKTESPTTKTFTFKDRLCAKAKPGQFLMLWIPRVDEIPLSIMNVEGNKASVTVKATLLFLAKKLAAKAKRLALVIGAKTKTELLFLNQLEALCTEQSTVATTEDGSYGLKCLATEPLDKLLNKEKFDMIYACGPEPMIRQVFDLTENRGIAMEASLERLMRCGIGLCGSCVIGKYRVCRDGPVFTAAQLSEVKDELGISKLGFDGNRIPF